MNQSMALLTTCSSTFPCNKSSTWFLNRTASLLPSRPSPPPHAHIVKAASCTPTETLADNITIKQPYPPLTTGNKRTTWRRLLSHKTKLPPLHTSEIWCMSTVLGVSVYLQGTREEGHLAGRRLLAGRLCLRRVQIIKVSCYSLGRASPQAGGGLRLQYSSSKKNWLTYWQEK